MIYAQCLKLGIKENKCRRTAKGIFYGPQKAKRPAAICQELGQCAGKCYRTVEDTKQIIDLCSETGVKLTDPVSQYTILVISIHYAYFPTGD